MGLDWESALKDIEHAGRDVVKGAESAKSAADKWTRWEMYKAAQAAGDVAGPAEDIAAEAASRIGVRGGLGEVGLALLAGDTLKNALKLPFRLLPSWLSGPGNRAIDWFFQPLTNLENWIFQGFYRDGPAYVPGWRTLLDYLLPQTKTVQHLVTQVLPGSPTLAGVETQLHKLQTLSDYQQREIEQLQAHTGTGGTSVVVQKTTVMAVPPTLEEQILATQARVTLLEQDMTDTRSKLAEQSDLLQRLRTEVGQLSSEIGHVRSTVASWPDVQQQLQQTMLAVEVTLDQIDTQTLRNTENITSLSPLLLLLEAGQPGLKVLRQLEDTPCMCPHLPGLPNELGALLAAYEFATHG